MQIDGATIEKVFKYTRADVFDATNGVQSPGVYNQIRGDFFFTLPQEKKQQLTHKVIKKPKTSSKEIWKDKESGLIWQVNVPSKTYNWSEAKSYCRDLKLAGYSNWKLPNRDELISIITKNSYANAKSYSNKTYIKKPLLDSMSMKSQWFWSSAEYKNNSSKAWGVDFDDGFDVYDGKSNESYVRCVVGRQ